MGDLPFWFGVTLSRHEGEFSSSRAWMQQQLKLLLIGDGGVGKTSLLVSYTSGTFPLYVPILCGNQSCLVQVDDFVIDLDLWDIASEEDHHHMRPLYYPHTDVFLILFSILDRASFNAVNTDWLPEITHHCPHVPWLLVGSKIDVRSNEATREHVEEKGLDVISTKEGEEMAQRLGAVGYVECSALAGENVKQLFAYAINIGIRNKSIMDPQKTRSRSLFSSLFSRG